MASIIEQLTAAAITDKLDAARTEEEWPKLGWATVSRGTFGSGSAGWKPTGYTGGKAPPVSASGALYKVAKLTGGNAYTILEIQNNYGLINTAEEPRTFSVWVFAQEGATVNGYQLVAVQASSGSGTPKKYKFRLRKFVGGTPTLLEETGEVTIETGGAFALAVLKGKLTMYRRETSGSAWVQVGAEHSDSEYNEGFSAIDGNGSNPVLTNFRTGLLTEEGAGKTVQVLVGGVLKAVKRWILVKGELVSK